MYPCPVISREERDEFIRFWGARREIVEKEATAGRVSSDCAVWFYLLTAIGHIGYDWGQIRPGKLGQWDVYYSLIDLNVKIPREQALICSSLTEAEVTKEDRDREIVRLKKLLGR